MSLFLENVHLWYNLIPASFFREHYISIYIYLWNSSLASLVKKKNATGVKWDSVRANIYVTFGQG